jgi:hypothetical protein
VWVGEEEREEEKDKKGPRRKERVGRRREGEG